MSSSFKLRVGSLVLLNQVFEFHLNVQFQGGGAMVRFEVDQMIKALGLADKAHELSKNLSGGMKRKLSCANALIGDSKIVFLDEPTSGLIFPLNSQL